MFYFSHASREKLNTCHSDLQALFEQVILYYDCAVVCGHRGEAEQNEAFSTGHSQLRWPESKHNSYPSIAVDVAPYETNYIDWGKTQSAYFAGFVKGIAEMLFSMGVMRHKIRCGIDWNNNQDVDDTKFWDGSHFELII